MSGPECCGLSRESKVRIGLVLALLIIAAAMLLNGPLVSPREDLTVTTEPSGASIFVNGRLAGATPLVIRGLDSGSYSIRFEKENFTTRTRNIQIKRGAGPIHEKLPAIATGTVRIEVKPDGAEVVLDGEFQGHSPLYLPDVAAGEHDLVVRKTNFNTYSQRIMVEAGQPLKFNDELEDKIQIMLNGNIAKEPTRVAHYIDMGHYLFVNNRLNESAEMYAQALEVSGMPLEFAADVPADERRLEVRLRAEDQNRLNEELRHKEHWPGKDLAQFVKIVERAREVVTNAGNFKDWNWAQEQANNYIRDGRLEDAHRLLLRHIDMAKDNPLLAQAYINLLQLRLKMKKIEPVRETYKTFMNLYGSRPELLRQAGNAVYSTQSNYDGKQRDEVLTMAETMFRKGVALSKNGEPELLALCNFELGNVLTLQNRAEDALKPYRDSIDGTRDLPTKELRSQRLVDSMKTLRHFADARKVLLVLEKSKTPEVADRAKQDLKEIDLLEPSPDNNK